MRRGFGVIAAVVAAVAAGPRSAPAQSATEPQYWRARKVIFPVSVDQINAANPKPAKLRFYVAPNRGEWQKVSEVAPADLEPIDPGSTRRGFQYVTPTDGEYDFALQLVFPDGTTQPRTGELVAERRLIVDTRPPVVKVATPGPSTVEWAVDDENLRPDGVTVETRWQGERDWVAIRPRSFRPRDSYTWNGLTARDVLEVRILARDKAGLEMASRVISLPAAGGGGGGLGSDPFPRVNRNGSNGSGGGASADSAAPEKSYSNTRSLTITSKLKVTRSGVRAAHLWMSDGKTGWKKVKDVDGLTITPNTPDPSVRIDYAVDRDGLYGFIVIPENGAGNKEADPRSDVTAQFLIEVDTEKPHVKITNVRVVGPGARGPKVEIEWEATDNNLWPEPITLEYAPSRTAAEWKPIHPDRARLPNSGRYVWEVEDRDLWKFVVRARALDMAGLEGQDVYAKDVVIDLDVPKATIEKVQGSGGPQSAAPPHPTERPDPPQVSRQPDPPPAANPLLPVSAPPAADEKKPLPTPPAADDKKPLPTPVPVPVPAPLPERKPDDNPGIPPLPAGPIKIDPPKKP